MQYGGAVVFSTVASQHGIEFSRLGAFLCAACMFQLHNPVQW